jgi:hypothetical protein
MDDNHKDDTDVSSASLTQSTRAGDDSGQEDSSYSYHSLDGHATDDESGVAGTDLDALEAQVFGRTPSPTLESVDEEESSSGNAHVTDLGGLYDRRNAVDQDADSPEVGTFGHPGVDEDTF